MPVLRTRTGARTLAGGCAGQREEVNDAGQAASAHGSRLARAAQNGAMLR